MNGSARAGDSSAAPGDLVSLERIGVIPHLAIRALAWRQRVAKALPTDRGVTMYCLAYWTTAPDGQVVIASALVSLPRGRRPLRGIVSWQHGTESLRRNAPSAKHLFHGVLPAALFGGRGYVLVAPDYLGYGLSQRQHDYFLADNMANVVRDGLLAATCALGQRQVAVPHRLFLAGFSEGGHATLATQRLLEREPMPGFELLASAPIAAPADLLLGIKATVEGKSRFSSLYIAWTAVTHARNYREPLTTVLTPPWAAVAESLFDGHHDADATTAALPAVPTEMLSKEITAALADGSPHWFVDRLRENSLLGWIPRAPIRAYYGLADVDVPTEQALLLQDDYRASGADVTAICVGDVDHDLTIANAAPMVRNWFDSLLPTDH